jgi:catechol 2,3-dioxygenase-like lactoylglutathione lyase family enzyme
MTDIKRGFSWGHININVRDLDRSIEFYRKFGFEIFIPGVPYVGLSDDAAAKPLPNDTAEALGLDNDVRGRACIMQLDDGFPKIDLTEFVGLNQNEPLRNSDLGLVRICLVTENLQSDVDRLKAEGVEFISEPKAGHMGLADMAVCRDPDGSLIELLQVYLERWEPLLTTK